MTKKSVIVFLVVLLTGLSFSACRKKSAPPPAGKTGPGAEAPATGDAIIVGSIGDASTLIPILASDSASAEIAGLVYNGLIKYDKDLNIVGDLAQSWEISKDGLTITFHLRPGVKWHDGKPFSAEDALFTYQAITDPRTPTAYASAFLEVREAKVLDPNTFQVSYKQPFAPALDSWGVGIIPQHLLANQDLTKSSLVRNPVGTGYYRFGGWKTGEKIELSFNPNYFAGRPYIDRYIYRIIPDQATMFLELLSGGVDEVGLTPLQYARQSENARFRESYNRYRYLTFSYSYLGFNLKDPRFADKRVRQAIASAIDKKEIIDGVLFGLGVEATGPYRPNTWYYNPGVKKYPYDPDQARKLLKEAGYEDRNGDGILDKDGQPFEFTILTNQGNITRSRTAEIIQRRLKKIGISVKIRILEWSAFINEFIDKRRFEVVILGWQMGPEPDQFDIWHSSKTKEKELNFVNFINPEVDQLLEQGRHTFDLEKRKQAYFRIQEILAEEQPYVFLFYPEALPAIQKRFRGIEPAPAGISYNFEKWYVPKPFQRYSW
ncbi:MAG: peptide-binding protein [bacterium]|nr:peptide-binding protein [bacterium]